MENIGIDLGAAYSHVAMMDEAGKLRSQQKVRTAQLPDWLARQAHSRVVMETCTQSSAVARAALQAGHEVRVVPGQLVRALGVGGRGIKTDERDALVLARASSRIEDLPSVHLRGDASRSLHELLSSRSTLLKARKSLSLNCKSWLRGRLVSVVGRANSKHFSETVRKLALEHPEGLPSGLEALLASFDALTEQIDRLDAELKQLAEGHELSQRLQTVPGVGVQVSLSFIVQLDDPHRFKSSNELGSYLGLVPGESTTGGKVKRTGTLKAGPTQLKALLVQAAWAMWRSRQGEPLVRWARALADKRGKRIAIVALARKIAVILWAMWRHGQNYDATRTSGPAVIATANA